ncbi:hypothetical protein GCM10009661_00860 [Catellatospora chokoriensis]|uniref:Uncharacterized protein n=1 Tax=Catellatospora chokoriensis TaxID=310353 RepID=A0A8J3NV51_9ACTN|nr:hypothetical protein Cch02nite_53390 [Catellatospora chokoriensis]
MKSAADRTGRGSGATLPAAGAVSTPDTQGQRRGRRHDGRATTTAVVGPSTPVNPQAPPQTTAVPATVHEDNFAKTSPLTGGFD